MKLIVVLFTLCVLCACGPEPAPKADYPFQPVAFTDVQFTDGFWAPRLETNRTVTIPVCFRRSEETGRIDNFLRAAGKLDGDYEGLRYNDSDVFKAIEAAAFSLGVTPDPELDAQLDELIAKIAAAQEPDGYLFAIRTVNSGEDLPRIGPERWSHLIESHELYNVGHLYEAAAAHYQATGKRSLLDIATKSAGLIYATFGPNGIRDVPGHEEIEIGLVKLYRVTGERKYLELSQFFVDERGNPERLTMASERRGRDYSQDHLPIREQSTAVGHAVRAGYYYAGVTDIAALTADETYQPALDRIWHSIVDRRMYITGGVGAQRQHEGFGEDYDLPNDTAYNETCAAIANGIWNHRMFLMTGDVRYIDVLERTLYNGFLSGVSLSGDLFFYPNPLSSDGKTKFNQGQATRSEWFRTSCCPSNVARIMPSIPGYVYASRGNDLYVNLYVGSEANVQTQGGAVKLRQETEYPWQGAVGITINPGETRRFALNLRIPGWARNQPVPSDLYEYADEAPPEPAALSVNGEAQALTVQNGYARIEREWSDGDRVELKLAMPVRRVVAHSSVAADAGRIALERGPVVYCVEGVDNGGSVTGIKVGAEPITAEHRGDLLGGVTVLEGPGFTAVPYYAWSNRGVGEMAVWLAGDGD